MTTWNQSVMLCSRPPASSPQDFRPCISCEMAKFWNDRALIFQDAGARLMRRPALLRHFERERQQHASDAMLYALKARKR